MLLDAHELGLGTCWIGEILKNEDKVRGLLGVIEGNDTVLESYKRYVIIY